MGRTTAAAAVTLLVNLCTSSHGQELRPAAKKTDKIPRRSLRSGMAGDDFLKGGEGHSGQFHTTAEKAALQQQNSFYDLDAFTAKEVSLYDGRPS